jgi:hypothetical protein
VPKSEPSSVIDCVTRQRTSTPFLGDLVRGVPGRRDFDPGCRLDARERFADLGVDLRRGARGIAVLDFHPQPCVHAVVGDTLRCRRRHDDARQDRLRRIGRVRGAREDRAQQCDDEALHANFLT